MIRSSPDDWRLQASFLTAIPSFSSTTGDSLRLPLYKSPRFVNRLKDRKSTRLNSSHVEISYAVFCLKKKISKDPHRAKERIVQLSDVKTRLQAQHFLVIHMAVHDAEIANVYPATVPPDVRQVTLRSA